MTATIPEKARSTKLNDSELAAQARTKIALAHRVPLFDLASEPWIPVVRDGVVSHVGIRDLFSSAHEITDIAVPNPLLRAALRRFLLALTADAVGTERAMAVDDWRSVHDTNAGFTPVQVAALIDRHAEHLWVWHPTSPFLQDMRLASLTMKPQSDLPIQDLVLHLPSGSSATWWIKAGEPALQGGLAGPDMAMWLVARWFYAVNGNCGDIAVGGGKSSGSQSGGAFAETMATITHTFRVDGTSLFRTLLRGLPSVLDPALAPEQGDPLVKGCAWRDPLQPRPSGAALYQATLNPAAVLLTGRDEMGNATRWLRASTPILSEQAKQLRDLAMDNDRHRVTVTNTKGIRSAVRVEPGSLRAEVLRAFHRSGFDGLRLNGIANSSDCWLQADTETVNAERLDLLLVSKAGTGSSPVWEDMTGFELPARHIDPSHPDPETVAHVRAAVAVAFDPKDGIPQRIELAVGDLLAQPGPDGWRRPKRDNPQASALTAAAVNDWLARTSDAFEKALDDQSATSIEQWQRAAFDTARDAFNEIASPYITSTRYAPRYAFALHNFNHKRPT